MASRLSETVTEDGLKLHPDTVAALRGEDEAAWRPSGRMIVIGAAAVGLLIGLLF